MYCQRTAAHRHHRHRRPCMSSPATSGRQCSSACLVLNEKDHGEEYKEQRGACHRRSRRCCRTWAAALPPKRSRRPRRWRRDQRRQSCGHSPPQTHCRRHWRRKQRLHVEAELEEGGEQQQLTGAPPRCCEHRHCQNRRRELHCRGSDCHCSRRCHRRRRHRPSPSLEGAAAPPLQVAAQEARSRSVHAPAPPHGRQRTCWT